MTGQGVGRRVFADHVEAIPQATGVMPAEGERPVQRISDTDIFEWIDCHDTEQG